MQAQPPRPQPTGFAEPPTGKMVLPPSPQPHATFTAPQAKLAWLPSQQRWCRPPPYRVGRGNLCGDSGTTRQRATVSVARPGPSTSTALSIRLSHLEPIVARCGRLRAAGLASTSGRPTPRPGSTTASTPSAGTTRPGVLQQAAATPCSVPRPEGTATPPMYVTPSQSPTRTPQQLRT